MSNLTNEEKEEVALALLLWRDYKNQGIAYDSSIVIKMLVLAEKLDIKQQLNNLFSVIPPMKIEPK
jgi:hypothetical protein